MKRFLCGTIVVLFTFLSAALAQDDVVIKAMRDELARSMKDLHLPDLDRPYFISYRIDDNTTAKISATLGQLTEENLYRGRHLGVIVRVGNFNLDNSNFLSIRGSDGFAGNCECHSTIPLDDDYTQIRRQIWLETDAAYRHAASELAAKRSVLEHRTHGKDLPDFTPQPATTTIEKPIVAKTDAHALENLAKELSSQFRSSPEFLFSSVDIWASNDYVRFVDSEGTTISRPEPIVVLDVRASLPASDGEPLRDWFRVYAGSPEQLQKDVLLAQTRDFITRFKALSVAKVLDQYNGPVLFEGEASAAVVAQILAPGIVAWRLPLSDEPAFEAQFQQVLNQFGGTLTDRLGARVLPEIFSLTDNPEISRFHDLPLYGSTHIDDEGTTSQVVKIIENGILKNLLAGRTPTSQTRASTGSVRGNGPAPSNLFLTAQNPKTTAELRKQLLDAAKQRGYDYGIIIRNTGVSTLSPLMRLASTAMGTPLGGGTAIYKVFADGHEELVRGEIEPLSLRAFKDILAAGDTASVMHTTFVPFAGPMFAGMSSSESSGKFTVSSFVVPSLLFEEISLKQPVNSAPPPPTLPSPLVASIK